MMVLISYDVNTTDDSGKTRLRKVAKECQNHAQRVQNSVFEGDIGEANLKKLKLELNKVIHNDEDSVILYRFESLNYSRREVIGQEKNAQEFIL